MPVASFSKYEVGIKYGILRECGWESVPNRLQESIEKLQELQQLRKEPTSGIR